MGIDILKLNAERNTAKPQISPADFAQPTYKTFHVPSPAMSIWMMTIPAGKTVFPWWKYNAGLDDDLAALNKDWNIPSQQGLFDCLTLSHLAKFGGNNLYAIFPGCVKTEGWGSLRAADRETFTRGQGCVYHLFGHYDTKLNVNWVPFWEPQSLVRNPNFGSLWRLFGSNNGDETTRCLTLFSVANPRKLPEIGNLLISKDPDRSAKLVALVDWLAVYTSPLDSKMGTCAALYTQNKDVVEKLAVIQTSLTSQIIQAQKDLLVETLPRTALRIMSRQVAL